MPQHRTLAAAGFTLLPVVLAMSLTGAIAFMLNRDNGLNANLIDSHFDLVRARYAAEAGLQAANYAIQAQGCAPPPPAIGQAFSPANINAGGVSTLIVTLSSSNVVAATLTAPLTETLPSGVVIAATPAVGTTCGVGAAPVAVAGASTVTLPAGRSIPANGSCTLTVNVTAAGGSYTNTVPGGALVTNKGNNALPAVATLTVIPASGSPMLGQAFSPASINAGGISTLTITLSNPNLLLLALLNAPLIDNLPTGLVIAATPAANANCGGIGAPVAVAGASTVTLPTALLRSIPANGSCQLWVNVTAALGGAYINTLPAGALVTANGNNAAPAAATLTVISPTPLPYPISSSPVTDSNFGGAAYTAYADNTSGSAPTLTSIGTYNGSSVTLTRLAVDTFHPGIQTWVTQPDAAGSKDTAANAGSPNSNYGDKDEISLDPGNAELLIQFDLQLMPAGSRIVPWYGAGKLQPGANLMLRRNNGHSATESLYVMLINRSWSETSATWNFPWPSPGAGYDPRPVSTNPYLTVSGWQNLDLTTAAIAWRNGLYPNNGVWIRPGPLVDKAKFALSSEATATNRPKLVVSYLLRCGEIAPP